MRKLKVAWTPTIEVSSLELVELYASLGFDVGLSVAIPRAGQREELRYLPLPVFPRLKIAALWTGKLSDFAGVFLQEIKAAATRIARHATTQRSLSKGFQMKGSNPTKAREIVSPALRKWALSKRFQMVSVRGSTQDKSPSEIFRFG